MPMEDISGAAGSGTGGVPAAVESAAPGAGAVSAPPAPVSAPPGAGLAPQGGSPAPAGAFPAGYVPVHEALRQYGYELPQGLEGQAALQHLVTQARQAQELRQLADYGRVYVQHADQFSAWMKQQQDAQRAQQAAQEKSWWKAPEFDPSWRAKLERDPQTGQLRAVQGADPGLVNKYLQALEHQQGFLDKFTMDPIGAIKPGIEEVARAIAQQVVQESLGGVQASGAVQTFEQQHASWLYAHDPQGNLMKDQQGAPQFSDWGSRFVRYGQALRQTGVQDMTQILQMSMAFVQRDFLMAQQQGQAAPVQAASLGDQAKANFLANAGAGGNGAGLVPGAQHQAQQGGSLVPGAAQNGRIPPAERMRQALKINGITDDVVNASLRGVQG